MSNYNILKTAANLDKILNAAASYAISSTRYPISLTIARHCI